MMLVICISIMAHAWWDCVEADGPPSPHSSPHNSCRHGCYHHLLLGISSAHNDHDQSWRLRFFRLWLPTTMEGEQRPVLFSIASRSLSLADLFLRLWLDRVYRRHPLLRLPWILLVCRLQSIVGTKASWLNGARTSFSVLYVARLDNSSNKGQRQRLPQRKPYGPHGRFVSGQFLLERSYSLDSENSNFLVWGSQTFVLDSSLSLYDLLVLGVTTPERLPWDFLI